VIPDDDDFSELPETSFRFIQYERIDAGSYVVHGEVVVNGEAQARRIPCKNPAFGFRKLEEEIIDALLLTVRDERKQPRKKRSGRTGSDHG
jgi:hypothetical protein